MAKRPLLVPFDRETGSIPSWTRDSFREGDSGHHDDLTYVWRPMAPVKCGTLKFDGFSRGRSSATAVFTDNGGRTRYEMFLTDIGDAIKLDSIVFMNGWLMAPGGVVMPVKRGANWGIRLLTDAEHREHFGIERKGKKS